MLDRGGTTLGRLDYVRRINVPLARVPRHVRAAFIAVEDRRFYYHGGVDWRSAARALVRNLREADVSEGFSTITMQVVRNAFVPRLAQQRSFRRKLIEIHLAHRLERALTKQQILALYLNVIYLGNGAFGVEAASQDLFGKSVDRLTVAEGATLAALARGPSVYAPRRHPDRALARRNLVLTVMAREHYLSDSAAARARATPLKLSPGALRPREDRSFALDPVRAVVDSVLGGDQVGDLIVYTTLDARAQRAAEDAVRRQADVIDRGSVPLRRSAGTSARRDTLQGALVALDPRNGELRAIVGARRYVPGGFNRALVARRQPGSAFKPFVYAAALAGGMTPAAVIMDTPIEITERGRIWRPVNFDGTYAGRLTLRRALMRSANAATVRLGEAVGERRVAALARRAGIRSPLDAVPALALGSGAVTPLELAAAYAPFANGGLRVTPSLVRRIEAGDGTVLWRAPVPVGRAGARRGGGVSAHLDAQIGGRWRYRPAGARSRRPRARRRQDGHDQRRHRCLVRRLHADRGRRGLVRVRRAPPDRARRLRRPPGRAGLGGLLPRRLARAHAVGLDAARGHGEPDDRRVQRRSLERVVPRGPARVVSCGHRAHPHLPRAQRAVHRPAGGTREEIGEGGEGFVGVVGRAVRRSGGQAVRRSGGQAVRRSGGQAVRRSGSQSRKCK